MLAVSQPVDTFIQNPDQSFKPTLPLPWFVSSPGPTADKPLEQQQVTLFSTLSPTASKNNNFELYVCPCTSSGICSTTPYSRLDGDLFVCVHLHQGKQLGTSRKLIEVYRFMLEQYNYNYNISRNILDMSGEVIINEGISVQAHASASCLSTGESCVIRMPVDDLFFSSSTSVSTLMAWGTIIVGERLSSCRQRLRHAPCHNQQRRARAHSSFQRHEPKRTALDIHVEILLQQEEMNQKDEKKELSSMDNATVIVEANHTDKDVLSQEKLNNAKNNYSIENSNNTSSISESNIYNGTVDIFDSISLNDTDLSKSIRNYTIDIPETENSKKSNNMFGVSESSVSDGGHNATKLKKLDDIFSKTNINSTNEVFEANLNHTGNVHDSVVFNNSDKSFEARSENFTDDDNLTNGFLNDTEGTFEAQNINITKTNLGAGSSDVSESAASSNNNAITRPNIDTSATNSGTLSSNKSRISPKLWVFLFGLIILIITCFCCVRRCNSKDFS